MNSHVLVVVPRPQGVEVDPGASKVIAEGSLLGEIGVFGPAPQSTCEAAISNFDRERFDFRVVPLNELNIPRSSLARHAEAMAGRS